MSERWGDRDITEDTGIVVERLDSIEDALRRIADLLDERLPTLALPSTDSEGAE